MPPLAAKPSVLHLKRAAVRYREERAELFAASITYFSFLALFPLVMIAFAVAGVVLVNNPHLIGDIKKNVTENVPSDLGTTINNLIDQAIRQRYAVGVVGLAGALYSGVGWMRNLRRALQAQWGHNLEKEPFLATKVRDLGTLVGLGLALVVSFGLTAVGSAFTGTVLDAVGIEANVVARFFAGLVAVALGVGADVLVFSYVLKAVPREPVTYRSVVRAATFAAVGFDLLKVFGTFYFKQVNTSPAAGVFGSVIGLLVFIFTICRFLLFATAWAATEDKRTQPVREVVVASVVGAEPEPVVVPDEGHGPDIPDPRATSLVGAGAVTGSVLTAAAAFFLHRAQARD